MKKIKVIIKETNHSLDNVAVADSLISRIIGLMFKKELVGYNALLIKPCNSIHTFFMFFDLDILFLSNNGKIVKIIRKMKPWRMSWIYFKASQVLELKGGTLPLNVSRGMSVEVLDV